MHPDTILARVAAGFDLTVADLTGLSRRRALVIARQAAALALRTSGLTWQEVACAIGRRDHTTAIYHAEQAQARLGRDAAFAQRLQPILDALTAPPPAPAPVLRRQLIQAAIKIGALEDGEHYWCLESFGFFRHQPTA
jgi:hypothetical protein